LPDARCFFVITRSGQISNVFVFTRLYQVWTCLFEPCTKVVWKNPDKAGQTVDPLRLGRYSGRKQIAADIQKADGLPVTYEDTSDGLWHAMPVELDGYNAAA
jgi:hypothetical protein